MTGDQLFHLGYNSFELTVSFGLISDHTILIILRSVFWKRFFLLNENSGDIFLRIHILRCGSDFSVNDMIIQTGLANPFFLEHLEIRHVIQLYMTCLFVSQLFILYVTNSLLDILV